MFDFQFTGHTSMFDFQFTGHTSMLGFTKHPSYHNVGICLDLAGLFPGANDSRNAQQRF
jgi:hypothetical protein